MEGQAILSDDNSLGNHGLNPLARGATKGLAGPPVSASRPILNDASLATPFPPSCLTTHKAVLIGPASLLL